MCISLEVLAARAKDFSDANPQIQATVGELMVCLALLEKSRPKRQEKKSEPVPGWLLARLREPHTYLSAPELLQSAGLDPLSQRAMRDVRAWLLQLGYKAARMNGRSVYLK